MADIKHNKLIRLSKSCLSDAEKQAVMGVLDREFLGMGPDVDQFEKALSDFFGRPVICVVNGTAALHLALQACGIGRGDEVLLPSLTYIASFQAISATGASSVSCDINSETFLLDLENAKKRITQKTKAIMPVHYTGGVGDLDAVYTFAKKNGLKVIEDAAHAFGSTYKGKRVGSFGEVACFSFDGIKNITSGEGGCIITEDENILQKVRDARLLGVEKDTDRRYLGERSWEFDTTAQGWRYHMSNIMAAIGLEQLKRFPYFAKKRQQLAKQYDSLFTNHPVIKSIPRDYETVVPHIYVVRIIGMKNRRIIQQELADSNIQVGYHYQPNHWLKYFSGESPILLPITDAIVPELLTLPLHPDLTESDIEYVASKLEKIVENQDGW